MKSFKYQIINGDSPAKQVSHVGIISNIMPSVIIIITFLVYASSMFSSGEVVAMPNDSSLSSKCGTVTKTTVIRVDDKIYRLDPTKLYKYLKIKEFNPTFGSYEYTMPGIFKNSDATVVVSVGMDENKYGKLMILYINNDEPGIDNTLFGFEMNYRPVRLGDPGFQFVLLDEEGNLNPLLKPYIANAKSGTGYALVVQRGSSHYVWLLPYHFDVPILFPIEKPGNDANIVLGENSMQFNNGSKNELDVKMRYLNKGTTFNLDGAPEKNEHPRVSDDRVSIDGNSLVVLGPDDYLKTLNPSELSEYFGSEKGFGGYKQIIYDLDQGQLAILGGRTGKGFLFVGEKAVTLLVVPTYENQIEVLRLSKNELVVRNVEVAFNKERMNVSIGTRSIVWLEFNGETHEVCLYNIFTGLFIRKDLKTELGENSIVTYDPQLGEVRVNGEVVFEEGRELKLYEGSTLKLKR
ncbi:MAG: hypothetical protein ISS16_08775 [Ignavibacteria bacterium]|nr:hypothetical protein [Ignavibacteria bacterium]